jgi:DNA-binding transcriptional regulator LsrR (DeoR family)
VKNQFHNIAEAAAAWSDLTMIVTGIGSARPSPQRRSWDSALPPQDLDRLAGLKAVGDVCLNFFDRNGEPVDGGLRDPVIGIGVDDLRAVPRRIGVAGGHFKVEAIRAAALGGWVNVLVTDQFTARRLLADIDGSPD